MATLVVTGNARSAVVLYLVTVLLTASVELSYSPAAQIICTRWQSGRHRTSRRWSALLLCDKSLRSSMASSPN